MLKVENVKKKFKNKEVLKNISFEINDGEIVSLLGSNGSGKTTTFKIILNYLKADEGSITYNGYPITNDMIGFLSEKRSLYLDCTVYQQLKLVTGLNNIEESIANELIYQYLSNYGLLDNKLTPIKKLSKGNQQKVSLIVALIKDPQIIIMDEPFTGLDIDNVDLFKREIIKLKEKGKIIIISSHIYQPINDICDHYLYLNEGIIDKDITKAQMEEDKRRVLVIKGKYVNIINDGIIKEIRSEGMVTYIVEDKKVALSIIDNGFINHHDYYYGHLRIEDLFEL